MNEKHIYLVRHGQSRANATGVFEGADSPLTEAGIAQAQRVAERFTHMPIEIVLTSDMERATHTGRIIAEHIGVPSEVISRAHEQERHKRVYGTSRRTRLTQLLENGIWTAFRLGFNFPGAETFESIHERAQHVERVLLERPEDRIVLVTHGNFLKFFTLMLMSEDTLTPKLFATMNAHMRTQNTGITYLTYHPKQGWFLRAWNDHAHLG